MPALVLDRWTNRASADLDVQLRLELTSALVSFLTSRLLRLLATETRQVGMRVRVSRLELEQGSFRGMVMVIVMDLGCLRLLRCFLELLQVLVRLITSR